MSNRSVVITYHGRATSGSICQGNGEDEIGSAGMTLGSFWRKKKKNIGGRKKQQGSHSRTGEYGAWIHLSSSRRTSSQFFLLKHMLGNLAASPS